MLIYLKTSHFSFGLHLVVFIVYVQSVDLEGWGTVKTISLSYFKTPVQNILRCEKMCARQEKCSAVTFDKAERMCFMHEEMPPEGVQNTTSGRFLFKKRGENSTVATSRPACDRDTQIDVPSARRENGACYAIKDITTPPADDYPTSPTDDYTTPSTDRYTTPPTVSGTYIDCFDVLLDGKNVSGVYNVYFSNRSEAVYCDQDTDGGGWLVFQRRTDGSEDFYRNWTDYAHGFGDIENEFWMGNELLAELTAQKNYTLRIDLESFEDGTRFAKYGTFSIGPAQTKFTLSVGSYTGTAGDSLTRHNGYQFTTEDQDNDAKSYNCAIEFHGAWWYKNCHDSNLNGFYHGGSHSSYADGINWRHWLGYYNSLKKTEMKCRPTRAD